MILRILSAMKIQMDRANIVTDNMDALCEESVLRKSQKISSVESKKGPSLMDGKIFMMHIGRTQSFM